MVSETAKIEQTKKPEGQSLSPGDRIRRLQRRYQTAMAHISVERARYYTQSWKQTESRGLAREIRIGLAMKNVYANMTHYIDPDDRIAGCWCEHFLGIPIDIERGVFNRVFEHELSKTAMLQSRVAGLGKGLAFVARQRSLGEFIRNQRITSCKGKAPLNLDLKTMPERAINPFDIDDRDRRELCEDLLPYWKHRCLVDRLEKKIAQSDLIAEDMRHFIHVLPGSTSRQILMLSTCSTIATLQGHVILDYEKVLAMGLDAMASEVRSRIGQCENQAGAPIDFLRSVELALEGVLIFARRLVEKIEDERTRQVDPRRIQVLQNMLDICRKAPFAPAETFEQAVQAIWTVKTAVELAHPVNLHCFGRLDQALYPYYKADIQAARITKDLARRRLEELLLKIMSQNIRPESNILANFYHRYLGSSPVTVGGVTADGDDATNDLTYLFIEAAHNSKAITNLSVRLHPKTPDAVLEKVAACLQAGTSSYSLVNDEIHIEAMMRRGFTEKDARNYAVMGCVEDTCPGKTGSMSANSLELSRLLDITLRNGDSATMGGTVKADGLKTGDPDSFKTFEDLLQAFFAQARFFIGKIVAGSNLRDRIYAELLPAPHISAFMGGCLESGRDVTRGGAAYQLSGISMINAIANLTDSLYAIKKLIYEQKEFSFRQMLTALENDFAGYEPVLAKINSLPGKWGNGFKETDDLAHRVARELFAETYKYKTENGGPFVAYAISMTTHTIDGRLSMASPDGRRAATPYAASCNPYNVEKSGMTAALRSVAALPGLDQAGCAVNMKFHPTAIGKTPETRKKWIRLIRTYFKLGGPQLQPTVADAQTLRAAQQHPDDFRDLIVKVGGYSTYFVELGREIQQEVIDRTEHGGGL